MRYLLLLITSFIYLSGCSNVKIADQVRFKVIFSKKIVQVSFDINPEFGKEMEAVVPYADLAAVYVRWDDEKKTNEIGTFISANPDKLEADWPTFIVKRFPNNTEFPSMISSKERIHQWLITTGNPMISLLYGYSPNLIFGGAIQAKELDGIKKSFSMTQKFKGGDGETKATITVLGPTDYGPGGVYFFGNLGENPFGRKEASELLAGRLDENEDEDILEWTIKATEPARIIKLGE